MMRCALLLASTLALATLALACGGRAAVDLGAGGQGGISVVGGAGGGSTGCQGPQPYCADFCGSDYLPERADCIGNEWVCPPGTVNPEDCPPGTCWGGPLVCEECGPNGWECYPTEQCVGSCEGLVCAVCPEPPDTNILGACLCRCDDYSQYTCELYPGCCNVDQDCDDAICADHVCKMPVDDGCWRDEDCQPGYQCEGAFICPCGWDCDAPDWPGTCVPV